MSRKLRKLNIGDWANIATIFQAIGVIAAIAFGIYELQKHIYSKKVAVFELQDKLESELSVFENILNESNINGQQIYNFYDKAQFLPKYGSLLEKAVDCVQWEVCNRDVASGLFCKHFFNYATILTFHYFRMANIKVNNGKVTKENAENIKYFLSPYEGLHVILESEWAQSCIDPGSYQIILAGEAKLVKLRDELFHNRF